MVSLSTLLHGIIGFDRYLFIVHPLKYQVHVNSKRLAVCLGVFLLFALSLPVAILLSGNHHQFVLPAMTCAPPTIWPVLYIILIFVPSVSLASVSYQRIWRLCSNAVRQNMKTEVHRASFRPKTISAEVKDKDVLTTSQDNAPPTQPVFTVSRESKTIQQRSSTIIHENTTIFTRTTSDFAQMSESTSKKDSSLELKRPSRTSRPTTIYVKEKKEQNIKNVRKVSERIQEITTTQTGMPMSFYGLELPTNKCTDRVLSHTDPLNCPCPSNEWGISTPVVKVQSPSTEVVNAKKAKENILHQALDQVYLATKPTSAHRLSPSPNRKDKMRLNTLQWTAVYNPVITWMLTNEASCDSSSVGGVDSVNSSTGSVRRHVQSMVSRDTCGSCSLTSSLRRMCRVSVLILLPVLGIAMSFLPYLCSLLLWEHGSKTVRDFWVVRTICHITFAIMPSATSLLLCVTNKPYRCVFRQRLCACKQTRLHSTR